ncbi:MULTISPECIES: hypothetical protein [Nostoc]|uniref:Uncharacterized protein n=1 Tax=Nostoc paludosum FACHB-159 TaxID=2692908 RepID=A0ABR8KIS0_9NOSO|nr:MULTISPECIES: hypothetical protein [Nostoc]MBD2681780.1 hypothetical protein [Nostoc sp. FACHB-857]MBD2738195.1 hypothetical protein [Nostoc paludosum FACHB-159]
MRSPCLYVEDYGAAVGGEEAIASLFKGGKPKSDAYSGRVRLKVDIAFYSSEPAERLVEKKQ